MKGALDKSSEFPGASQAGGVSLRLSRYSTAGIGGVPAFFSRPRSVDELFEMTEFFRSKKIPFVIVGNMSNVLFPDGPLSAAVIQIKDGFFSQLERQGRFLVCGAGVLLSRAIKETFLAGLSGLEGLVGIPGSCGGASYMNASGKTSISDIIESAEVADLENRKIRTMDKKDLRFAYRTSSLRFGKDVILSVRFGLKPRDKSEMLLELRENMSAKMRSQPLLEKSLGCVFRNPSKDTPSAGELLDRAGLKGIASGGALFSSKHANFIVNKRDASYNDFVNLIREGKERVLELFGVELEEEIRVLENGR